MKKLGLVLFSLMLIAACRTNRAALRAAGCNAKLIKGVTIGQSMDQVRAQMRKGPESTSIKTLADGTREEIWNYVTDYNSDTDTSILFRGGRVAEITPTRWLGNGDFTIRVNCPE